MENKTSFDFKEFVSWRREAVESRLRHYLSQDNPGQLWESMRYSVLSGGKRLRALLCLAAAESVNFLCMEKALPCACAIELVHAMSLIHDDLPCLDNDAFRRGRPSNQKVFGEAMAVLSGDALLAYVFELLIKELGGQVEASTLLAVVEKFSRALGPNGMVGGQVEDLVLTGLAPDIKHTVNLHMKSPDIINAGNSGLDSKALESMHSKKTGALIAFAAWSGATVGGATPTQANALEHFGEVLGLAFQITDDLLDITGDIKELGKTPGKDQAAHKTTWVSYYGIDKSKEYVMELQMIAKKILVGSGIKSDSLLPLESLLQYAVDRMN